VAEIRSAIDSYPKESLAEILTYVFKEYVVEGPLPLAGSAASAVEAKSELEGMSFAQVVNWLQLHLDLPELALLDVQGERVSVKLGGQLVPLAAQASRPEPLVSPPPVAAPPAPPPQQAARPEARQGMMPVTPTPPLQTAPRPSAPPPAGQPMVPQAPAQQPQAAPDKKEEPAGDSSRFSLLEVD
jgi:hypothetical protein